MIVSEEQVRNVLKMHHQLQAENRPAAKMPETNTELSNLSTHTQEISSIMLSLSKTSDVRKERVAALKSNIIQGKYQPTAVHIASKMVNRSLVDNTLVQVNFYDI